MLAVVEDQQQLARLEIGAERLHDRAARLFADAEHLRGLARDKRAVADRRKIDEPRAVAVAVEHVARDLQRQPRLAQPADPGQREQSGSSQESLGILDFALAADKRRELLRQVVRRRFQRAQRRERLPKARMQQLVDSFRARESLEAHLTKVAERDPLVQPSDQPIRDRLREQHLATIGKRHDACRAVERRPQVVVAVPLGLPDVQAATDSERDTGRQRRVGECQLGRDDCGDTVDRIREHGHNAVAARLDHPPAIFLDGTAQQRVMRGRRPSPCARAPAPTSRCSPRCQ